MIEVSMTTGWWISLAAGAVVLVVVLALLEALRRTVKTLEQDVQKVLLMGGRVAQATWATHLLGETDANARRLAAALRNNAPEPIDAGRQEAT